MSDLLPGIKVEPSSASVQDFPVWRTRRKAIYQETYLGRFMAVVLISEQNEIVHELAPSIPNCAEDIIAFTHSRFQKEMRGINVFIIEVDEEGNFDLMDSIGGYTRWRRMTPETVRKLIELTKDV